MLKQEWSTPSLLEGIMCINLETIPHKSYRNRGIYSNGDLSQINHQYNYIYLKSITLRIYISINLLWQRLEGHIIVAWTTAILNL